MNGAIGANALYLLFVWLISAATASWMSERKGYGERLGLTFGLLLSAVGLLIVAAAARAPRLEVAGRRPAAAMAATAVAAPASSAAPEPTAR